MAYNYDEFGNVIGEYEREEERRKREEEAAKAADTTVAGEHKVTTYQNGSQTVETKQELPPSAAQVNAEVVANAKSMAPRVAVAQPQPTQTAPSQFDRNAYNISIAQQESGNRADIGYHDRSKSSAFGQFGITAPAYQDARRADPSLPADITQATPEQQTRAHNIITDNNARFLQQKGIEATPGVLSAAHFAGAGGLHKFLTQQDEQGRPYISPQAQAANGGYDKARAIIEGRLNGQAVASSGAAGRPTAQPQEGVAVATGNGVQGTMSMNQGPITPEQDLQQAQQFAQSQQQYAQPTPISPYSLATGNTGVGIRSPGIAAGQPVVEPTAQYQNLFQQSQDNVNGLTQLIDNADTPDYLKRRAADRRYELVNNAYQEQKAKEKIASLTPNEVAKTLSTTPKDQEGSYLKMLLLGFISPQLAGAEAIKLGLAPTRWETATITDENGKETAVEVQRRADGKLLSGNIAGTDRPLTAEQLGQASEGIMGKGVHVTKVENRINPKTGEVVTHQTLSNGKERYTIGGKTYAGDKESLVPEAQHTKQEDTRVNAGYNALGKLTSNPTPQQKFEALRNAGVSPNRIEQELGLQPGSLAGKTPTSQGTTTGAAAPAPAATAGTKLPATPGVSAKPVQEPGELNDVFKARLETWQKKQDRLEKRAEELPKIESNASDSIATVSDLLTHPGFSDVIGVPNVITGIFSPPGTDARDFKSKYKQLLGEQFLAGFNSLRGGGSITEVEGQQAKEAVAAMQDPYISEREFKRNAELYVNTMKRAVNRERALVGLDPKYPDVPEAGQTAATSGIKIIKREKI